MGRNEKGRSTPAYSPRPTALLRLLLHIDDPLLLGVALLAARGRRNPFCPRSRRRRGRARTALGSRAGSGSRRRVRRARFRLAARDRDDKSPQSRYCQQFVLKWSMHNGLLSRKVACFRLLVAGKRGCWSLEPGYRQTHRTSDQRPATSYHRITSRGPSQRCPAEWRPLSPLPSTRRSP